MIVLDTHVWIWWVDDASRLSPRIVRAIQESESANEIVVSVASIWEIALKSERGRLALPLEIRRWVENASSYPGIRIETLGVEDAIASAQLPERFHPDPFDRVIVALTRRLGAQLLTVDRQIIAYPHVRTIS